MHTLYPCEEKFSERQSALTRSADVSRTVSGMGIL